MYLKNNKKSNGKIYLFVSIFFIIVFSGCTGTDDNGEKNLSNPTVRIISGDNQVVNISGNTILVKGNFDEVNITNNDVARIVVSGSNNIISYPPGAHPEVENSNSGNLIRVYGSNLPAILTPIPTEEPVMDSVEDLPSRDTIKGYYIVQDISTKYLHIKGGNNKIKIINSNVSEIRINGNNNIVYYPKEANPTIIKIGLGNEVKPY